MKPAGHGKSIHVGALTASPLFFTWPFFFSLQGPVQFAFLYQATPPNRIMMDLFICMCPGPAGESLRVWLHDLSLYPSSLAHSKYSVNCLTNESLDVGGKWILSTRSRNCSHALWVRMKSLENKGKYYEQVGPPFPLLENKKRSL